MTTCRSPASWSARELQQAFRIEDATGQAVVYVYFRRDENEARQASVLTHDEARRIAANIAKCRSCCPPRARENRAPARRDSRGAHPAELAGAVRLTSR